MIAKATEEDPARRYAGAAQLGEDIKRSLVGFPIEAQRNVAASVAAGLALLSLFGGFAATWQKQRQTQKQFNEVREIATGFLCEFHSAIENLPGSTEARRLLVTRALKYLEALSSVSSDAYLATDVADAYTKMGNIQWASANGNLGDPSGAVASRRKALEIRERLYTASSKDFKFRSNLASSYADVATVMEFGLQDAANAQITQAKAIPLQDALLRDYPDNFEAVHSAAILYSLVGLSRLRAGQPQPDYDLFQRSIDTREAWRQRDANNPSNLRYPDWAYTYASDAQGRGGTEIQLGNRKEALALARKALGIFERIVTARPNKGTAQRDVGALQARVAGVYEAMGDWGRRLPSGRRRCAAHCGSTAPTPTAPRGTGVAAEEDRRGLEEASAAMR